MSMFVSKADYNVAKVKQLEGVIQELAMFFTSGNNIPIDFASISTKTFCKITGIDPKTLVK